MITTTRSRQSRDKADSASTDRKLRSHRTSARQDALKPKATAVSKGASKKASKRKAKAASPIVVEQGPSPFLDLPAELRNLIYEYAALDATAVLRSNVRAKLLSNSALMRVSKQTREEYTSALYLTAPLITAHVKDFDFSHIVTFLNKLSDRELNALPSLHIASQRSILVNLYITGVPAPYSDMLQRWLLRCEHPTKKGTNISVAYVAYGTYVYSPHPSYATIGHTFNVPLQLYRGGMLGSIPHAGTPVGDVYRAQHGALLKLEKAGLGEGRVYEELKKIVAALQVPRHPISRVEA